MTQYPELRVPIAENYVSCDLAIFTSEWAFYIITLTQYGR